MDEDPPPRRPATYCQTDDPQDERRHRDDHEGEQQEVGAGRIAEHEGLRALAEGVQHRLRDRQGRRGVEQRRQPAELCSPRDRGRVVRLPVHRRQGNATGDADSDHGPRSAPGFAPSPGGAATSSPSARARGGRMPITHPTTRERRVKTNGVELHVVEAGPEDGPPVVLCHGFPELAYSWRHQIPALADAGYRVVAPDQRGYGRPTGPSRSRPTTSTTSPTTCSGCSTTSAPTGPPRRPRLGLDGGRPDGAAPPRADDRGGGDERPAPPPRTHVARLPDARGVRRELLLHPLLPGAWCGRCGPRRRPRRHHDSDARRPGHPQR